MNMNIIKLLHFSKCFFVLFSFFRQMAAGRMPRPPHQWLHPQKDPEVFILTPPTDPLPHSSNTAPPDTSPKTWPLTSSGLGVTYSYVVTQRDSFVVQDDVFTITDFSYLDHLYAVISLHMGLISTLHSLYSFHFMSILPLSISLTLYIHTIGTVSTILPHVL